MASLLIQLLTVSALSAELESDCLGQASLADLMESSEQGLRALEEMDPEGLEQAQQSALTIIPCLSDRIRTQDAAAFHRLMALAAFVQADEERALSEFHAARRLEPGNNPLQDYFASEHPIMELYQRSSETDEGELMTITPPRGGFVRVDGVKGAMRPENISVLVQAYAEENHLVETRFLDRGEPSPDWRQHRSRSLTRELGQAVMWSTTGAAALSTVTLYAIARHRHQIFLDPSNPDDLQWGQLDQYAKTTNRITLGWMMSGAVALGSGVTAVVAF